MSKRDEIRLYYSGFVIFAAQILSVASGLIFTLLLTRNMTQQQFGVWANIFDVVSYFLLLSGVFPFWALRFIARGHHRAAKTGLLANLLVSLLLTFVYIATTPFITSLLHIGGTYLLVYLIASAQIVNIYLIAAFEAVLRAKRPQAIGYGLLVEEITKIVLAYIVIVGLKQLFLGALLSLIVGTSVQLLYYFRLTFDEMKKEIDWTRAKEWLKSSIVNIYNAAGNQLAAFTIIMLFIYGGQAARGNYQAAATYANMIGYSLFLSYALYPRLLAKSNSEEVTSTLRIVLTFAIPMTTIAISLSPSLLTILNVHFTDVSPVLVLLSIDALVTVITQFYSNVVLSGEELDENANIPLKQLVRSKIFKVFTLPYAQAAISIPLSFYILTVYTNDQNNTAAIAVTAINLGAHIASLCLLVAMMHKSVELKIPWMDIGKYVLAAALSAAIFYAAPRTTTILSTFSVTLLSGLIYASVLLAIDNNSRNLALAIVREIRGMFNRSETTIE